ncbi:MFS general substrate transporter [Thozetella sp. PMI_491]|nr:MFS general substrate transporter [Thozetella sp. PMI_491]
MASLEDSPTAVAVAESTEETPLLSTDQHLARQSEDGYRRRVVVFIFVIFFLIEFMASLFVPGYIAVLEQRICHDIYAGSDGVLPADPDCKTSAVQGKLASLRGWQTMLDCIPALVTTVPFGILSDKWGRHRVLALALVGTLLTMGYRIFVVYAQGLCPVELVLLAPIFGIVGGGPPVVLTMVYSSLGDIVSAESRSSIFLQLSSLFIISEILSGPLAGVIMMKSIWGVVFLSFGLLCLATLLGFFFPNTLGYVEARKRWQSNDYAGNADSALDNRTLSSVQGSLRRFWISLGEVWLFLSSNWLLSAVMLSFIFVALSRIVQDMLLQYTTTRYNWKWSKASFLLTIRSVASLLVLMAILPALGEFLTTRLKMSSTRKDIWIARITGLAGIFGSLLIAFAAQIDILILGLIVLAFNNGMPAVIRSLLSGMVEPDHLGALNSVIGVLEMVGLMLAAPSLFQSLRLGFELGGAWIGLPFFCAAGMISVSTAIIWFFPDREEASPIS